MNSTITKTILMVAIMLICTQFSASAQVTPTTTDVNLFCAGGAIILPDPVTNTPWILRYSASNDPTTAGAPLTLAADGKTVSVADTKTGYYFLSSKSTEAGSCESDMQMFPVYVLKPLVVDFAPANFCVETAPLAQVGTVTNPESSITTFTYQWFTSLNGVETKISGATSKDYTPPTSPVAVGFTKYVLKATYSISGKNYCVGTSTPKDVEVTAKPNRPIITPTTITGTAGAIVF